MRIAFVGKGGSGKTTISALFASYVTKQRNKAALVIDADLNACLHELLDISATPTPLSEPATFSWLKSYLRGTNPRIKNAASMIKTTPPGKGSNLIYLRNTDPVISNLTASKNNIYFAQVGAYQAADAGIHCYHNNLGALELFLSHLNDKPDDLVIIDMVAGVDAFATSLYHQIDIFLFVAEPIIESIHVGQNFIHLAEQNGIKHKIRTIGNKIEDETDREFLKTHLPIDVFIPNTSTIKQIRRRLQPIDFKILEAWDEPLRKISTYINSCSTDHNEILPLLHALHIRQARKASVIAEHGDITDQIDPTFKYS